MNISDHSRIQNKFKFHNSNNPPEKWPTINRILEDEWDFDEMSNLAVKPWTKSKH